MIVCGLTSTLWTAKLDDESCGKPVPLSQAVNMATNPMIGSNARNPARRNKVPVLFMKEPPNKIDSDSMSEIL
jgi:hypothetical protein